MKSIGSILKQSAKTVLRLFWTWNVRRSCGSLGGKIVVNHRSSLGKNCHLGKNVNFNGMQVSGGGDVRIGDNFHSGAECLIITSMHNFDHGKAIPYDGTYIHKDVLIKDNVWLGSRVIVLGGVTIGEGAIIQAGSVVVSDIPDCAIAGGHPAVVFKCRDLQHYTCLKDQQQFF